MEKAALFLFVCGVVSFAVATYLMTRGTRSTPSI
jgi:hypothetical protein